MHKGTYEQSRGADSGIDLVSLILPARSDRCLRLVPLCGRGAEHSSFGTSNTSVSTLYEMYRSLIKF